MHTAAWSRLGLFLLLILSGTVGLGAACNGRARQPAVTTESNAPASNDPTLRIYYLVDLDGYLEPCGCQSRPLGGIDRLARFIESQRTIAPRSIFVATGNLIYRDPTLDPRMEYQESTKADAMVRILDQLALTAFAPGPSDFVRGADAWRHAIALGHASPVAANVTGPLASAFRNVVLRDVAGTRVGIVGVSDFRETADATPPPGAPPTSDPIASARAGVDEARRQGATLVIVLASVPRRVARSIAGDVAGVNFVVAAREESNTAPPPEHVGNAYLVTATNQGKSVGIVDVFVRPGGAAMVDASRASTDATRTRLDARITELRGRIDAWQRDPSVDHAAVDQQRARLAQLERDRAAMNTAPTRPARGSFFDARVQEIAPELPKRHDVEESIASYFHGVNEHNHQAYAELRTPEPAAGQPGYVGDEACRDCHEDAYNIWIRTPHSRAYNTLAVISKNYNLSCVGCHVTGYRRPGGAEVVQNEGRRDVQCESCHGPGSLHVAARNDAARRATIRRDVPGTFCASECHTPEHSDHFDYAVYRPRILGPGHGYPLGSTEGRVSLASPVLQGGATPPNSQSATQDAAPPLDASVSDVHAQ